jgi:hypothetical protein
MHLQTPDRLPEETPLYTDGWGNELPFAGEDSKIQRRVVKQGQGAKVETISFEDW